MNFPKTCVLISILLLSSTSKLRAEFISILKLTDLRGNSSYQICTDEEKKKLDLELRSEAKVYSESLELTKGEWNTTYKGTAFPSSRIKQRTMRVITTTSKREEADVLLGKLKTQDERSISQKREEEERILKMKPTRSRRGRSSNSSSIKQQQEDVKEDRTRDANADKAEVILRKNLSAAAGHEVPFFGFTPVKTAQKAASKKK